MAQAIEDYALVGDCQSAALVGFDGSVDWLCVPRFDSGACFAALLGNSEHGRWLLAPAGDVKGVRRRYRDDTLILETEHETADGAVRVIDFMPVRNDVPDLVRIVEGVRGRVSMRMDLTIRFDYGSIVPWVRRTDDGIRATGGPDSLYLRTPVRLRGENMHTVASFQVGAGDRVPFTLTWCPSFRETPEPKEPERSLAETERWWREWSARCEYEGEWRGPVIRSLITLKALTYSPTGGIVAAPTTSLPASVGGVRNWDYRYCWLRDSTFSLYALVVGGYAEEARQWQRWLVNAVAGEPSEAHIMYGLGGERRLTELELDYLPGYEGSRPVRIGNQAHKQHQLDVYGEVMDALHFCRRAEIPVSDDAWRVELAMLEFLESHWDDPDEGIWEVRGPQRHFTHSKVMAWVAFDRAVKSVERFGVDGPVEKWRHLRDSIRSEVMRRGFDPRVGSFVQYYGSDAPDASLLMLPLVGFIRADDDRMKGTVDYIRDRLIVEGLVHRYLPSSDLDGMPQGEGAFLLCTFWLIDNLALQGRHDEARSMFEGVLKLTNDVGLLSEGYDTAGHRFVGNFPQAFSHVGLINTARNLAGLEGGPAAHRPDQDPD